MFRQDNVNLKKERERKKSLAKMSCFTVGVSFIGYLLIKHSTFEES